MTIEAVTAFLERVGVPIALSVAAVVLFWRLGGTLLRALVESYRERIAGLEADRDHFRDRAESADDRMNGLCRELIDAARRRGGEGATDGD